MENDNIQINRITFLTDAKKDALAEKLAMAIQAVLPKIIQREIEKL